ncbi:Arylsulfatase B [Halotydeus destructor]|nr:Arylsulfatase B [Halotydeus destructor]
MADDIGWDDVGYHGSSDILTPNLDVLAADGIILHNYYTSPLCTPSRSAMLSGVHPINSGEQHFAIVNSEPRGFSLDFPLLSNYLKDGANYSTHLVGKWNLGFFRQIYTPLYRGFDSFYGYYGNKIDYFSYDSEHNDMSGFDLRHNLLPARNAHGYVTDIFTDRALKVIEEHEGSTPLYLHLAYPNTHCGGNARERLQAPDKYIRKFDYLPDTKRQIYAANLYTFDEAVGTVLRALSAKGMLGNTIIAFMSDNGAADRGVFPNFGSNVPLRGVKATMFEGGIRVPAFIWSPLLNRSDVFNGLFHVTDWVPTLLEAASVSIDERHRKSLYGVPQWSSVMEGTSARQSILHNIDPLDNNGMAAARVGDMKLIRGATESAVGGWYGERYLNGSSRTSTLRETSVARSVLRQLDRKPDFSRFKRTVLKCNPLLKLSRKSSLSFSGIISLFNITADPCELNNLAAFNEQIVNEMTSLIERHAETAIYPLNVAEDPMADPALHDGTWVSWGDVQYSAMIESSFASSIQANCFIVLVALAIIYA